MFFFEDAPHGAVQSAQQCTFNPQVWGKWHRFCTLTVDGGDSLGHDQVSAQ